MQKVEKKILDILCYFIHVQQFCGQNLHNHIHIRLKLTQFLLKFHIIINMNWVSEIA